jgi:hypothetical protein
MDNNSEVDARQDGCAAQPSLDEHEVLQFAAAAW